MFRDQGLDLMHTDLAKLQAAVSKILPPTTAVIGYAIGLSKTVH